MAFKQSGEDRAVFCRHTPADKGHNYVGGACRRSITTSDCWHTDIAWWIFMRIWDSSEWLANTVHRERHLVEHISSTFTLELWILYVNNTITTRTCYNYCLLSCDWQVLPALVTTPVSSVYRCAVNTSSGNMEMVMNAMEGFIDTLPGSRADIPTGMPNTDCRCTPHYSFGSHAAA